LRDFVGMEVVVRPLESPEDSGSGRDDDGYGHYKIDDRFP
jgi:hypothetical protein